MPHDPRPTHDAETDEIMAALEKAGLVESYVNLVGKTAMRLTEEGVGVGRSMALAGDGDAGVTLNALLEKKT